MLVGLMLLGATPSLTAQEPERAVGWAIEQYQRSQRAALLASAARGEAARGDGWSSLAPAAGVLASETRRAAGDDTPDLLCAGFTLDSQPASQPAGPPASAPESKDDGASELAKQTQNPVADLISVPFQNNTGFGAGADYSLGLRPRAFGALLSGRPRRALRDVTLRARDGNDVQNVLNIQPVIPISLSHEWNLINRVILPLIWQPQLLPRGDDEFGMGDLQYTAFFSPAKPGKLIWGVGPVFQFPTATSETLGTGKWSLGPSVVALAMDGPWVVGALGQQVFSIGGDSDRRYVSAMLIQPFINYNFQKGWYATFSPIITADWNAASENQWTVPLGGGVGKIVRIGRLPLNVSASGYYNVAKPDFAPDWTLRLQVAFLFPK
jgi:hypothetical protein